MLICEIFKSFQGEGKLLGTPCVFVRTWGCPVKCSFCDTRDSWGKTPPDFVRDLTLDKIVEEVEQKSYGDYPTELHSKVEWVVITGGEPAVQPDLAALVEKLHKANFKVALETSGYANIPSTFDHVAVAPKPALKFQIQVPLAYIDELKFVVTNNFNEKFIPEGWRELFKGRIWLQPNGYDMVTCSKICFKLCQKDSRLRCGIQLHKIYEVE